MDKETGKLFLNMALFAFVASVAIRLFAANAGVYASEAGLK